MQSIHACSGYAVYLSMPDTWQALFTFLLYAVTIDPRPQCGRVLPVQVLPSEAPHENPLLHSQHEFICHRLPQGRCIGTPEASRSHEKECTPVQAHMDLDIEAKIHLLNGVMGEPEDVVSMLRRQPAILAVSEVTIQVQPSYLIALVNLAGGAMPRWHQTCSPRVSLTHSGSHRPYAA